MSSDLTASICETYHPQFNSPEADITLSSLEGTLYRIPSFVLKSTSGFFESLLSLPSTSSSLSSSQLSSQSSSSSPIPTSQNDPILFPMLCLMSGLPIPAWSQDPSDDPDPEADDKRYTELETLLTLAESWEAPGPLSILRLGITAPMFLDQPLRLYAIATHFDWIPEAKLASKHSLALNLFDEEHEDALRRISAKHLLALLRLHRCRRDAFLAWLDDAEVFSLGNSENSRCTLASCNAEVDHAAWRELKFRIFKEMDRCSKGDFIGSWEMEEWKEAAKCWKAKCHKCNKVLYAKGQTVIKMRDGLDMLPDTI